MVHNIYTINANPCNRVRLHLPFTIESHIFLIKWL